MPYSWVLRNTSPRRLVYTTTLMNKYPESPEDCLFDADAAAIEPTSTNDATQHPLRMNASRRSLLRRFAGLGAGIVAIQAETEAAGSDPLDVDPGAVLTKLVRRVTQGVTAEELSLATSLGYDGYLDRHLNPESIDDSAMDEIVARYPRLTSNTFAQLYQMNQEYEVKQDLGKLLLLRSFYSKRQLFERVVEFWNDHFNMDVNINFGGYFKAVEDRTVIRANALGRFHDMLRATSTNPGILSFLTNTTNVRSHPNENFARELMELQTLGVDSGYTQHDVEDVARCFTGWSIVETNNPTSGGELYFHAEEHDTDEKLILGHTIPEGTGMDDGFMVLQILADHPATAKFISRKLCQWFLEEKPREALVDRVAVRFRQTRGDIKEVIREVLQPANVYLAAPKMKRPLHLITSVVRALDTQISDMWFLLLALRKMGHAPFEWGPPNGYPDTTAYWGGNQMDRWNFCTSVGENQMLDVQTDASRLFVGLVTPDQIIDRMNEHFFQGEMPPADRQQLLSFLDIDVASDSRRRAAVGLLTAMQGFQWY